MENKMNAEALLLFAIDRNITLLFRSFLTTIEDITDDHDDALLKLHASLPPEYKKYVELADYLGEPKCARIRKSILDNGNDCIRFLEKELEKYKVEFK